MTLYKYAYYYYYYFSGPGTQFSGNEKNYAMQYAIIVIIIIKFLKPTSTKPQAGKLG